jgi:hypothetical protein
MNSKKRKRVGQLTLFFFALACLAGTVGAGTAQAASSDSTRYLKCNIHAYDNGRDIKASYANWTNPGEGHLLIPVNTPIETQKWRKGFIFLTKDTGKKVYFEFHKGRMRMSVADYLELITSPEPISLGSFSEEDLKGISDGKARVGMTKTGVMTALGYPATHRTASLVENTWIYWRNRFRTLAVEFDDDGIVKGIRE